MKKHQFIIHHDLYRQEEGKKLIKPLLSQIGFPGHAYVEIQREKSELSEIYGFFPKGCKVNNARLDRAKEYQEQHPEERILFSKAFLINEDATDRIKAYTLKCTPEPIEILEDDPETAYNLFFNNCTDFVNRLFKLTGFAGLYSWHLTTEESTQILGAIREHVIGKMKPGDMPQMVKGTSIEEVAARYNIDPDLISEKKSHYMPLDMDAASMQELATYFVRYFVATNPLLTPVSVDKTGAQQEVQEAIESAKSEFVEQEKETSFGQFGVNQFMNQMLAELQSDPAKLAAYRQQSMSLTMQVLSEADAIIPGISDNILNSAYQSQAEYGDTSIFPNSQEMHNANKEAQAIADGTNHMLSKALDQVDLREDASSSVTRETQQHKPVSSASVDSETDFISDLLALSTISGQSAREAEQIMHSSMGSMGNMFANQDMSFLSGAFNPEMMGQFFSTDE
ncbi:MAG: hypothetical protein COB76_02195 [Alphaproteobacteria bacterium]|nr:MAG: hypothetical protein COB76_02195 [Alphaproteobacteria bacterium]